MQLDVDVVLFDGFELLDVFGPVEFLGSLPEHFRITYVAPEAGLVRSSQGAEVQATASIVSDRRPDLILVPGGMGTRALVLDTNFLESLAVYADGASWVTSVCTGSAVLAAAGLLEGYRATSNKRAFDWVTQFGAEVDWVREARWVHDRDRWTSSGVAAGMDLAGAVIRHFLGDQVAEAVAFDLEYAFQTDATVDPFAAGPQG
ncbi:ThiJ/PfpI family protein [Leucobacter sp. 7(1)]|uniref:DJ-1/PfpI family protein n=1 Tax=Leucobacter sp. 7(1) TaxID=1255613 RepID=UPI00097EC64B|nr:DJ-1/PfpI family protein [Leucobacter sp. 7(1)]SJN12839.1 ThiJ/PfpI family protein [Leucobacter sp. 7(1)]